MIIARLPVATTQTLIYRDTQRFGGSHQTTFGLHLSGPIGPVDGQAAIRGLIGRHQLLRSTFIEADGRVVRAQHDELALPFEVDDFVGRSETALKDAFSAEIARRFDLGTQGGCRVRWLILGPEEHVLLCTIHHMIYDHATVMAIIGHLIEMLTRRPHAAQMTDHATFVAREQAYLASSAVEADRRAVVNRLAGRALRLPVAPAPQGLQLVTGAAVPCAAVARPLQRGITYFHVVLGAWWAALCTWLGRSDVILGTTMSLRLDRELMRVFGPVFQYVPVLLEADARTPPDAATQAAALALAAARRGAWLPPALLPGGEDLPLGLNANVNFYDFDRFGTRHAVNRLRTQGVITEGALAIREQPLPDMPLRRPYDLNLAIVQLGGTLRMSLRWRPDLMTRHVADGMLERVIHRMCA